jgi:hypothetical protein
VVGQLVGWWGSLMWRVGAVECWWRQCVCVGVCLV